MIFETDDINYNLAWRIKYYNIREKHPILDALAQKDICNFFDCMLMTYDPRRKPVDMPFQLWDYQREFVKKINARIVAGKSILIEKSRDMGVTWLVLGVFLYRWLFHDENFLIGSQKESKVDTIGDISSLFGKLRYMIDNLPQFIKDKYSVADNKKYMKIYKSNGASIVGESMNENFGRQGRYKAILLDEFAFVEKSENIWTAVGDSAPCKIVVSTPCGSHNKFARLRNSGKIEVESLGWQQHPRKNEDWYRGEKAKRTEREIAQELDMNYIISAGLPFYSGFSRRIHLRKVSPIKNISLTLGWDYGFIHPCCIISQISSSGIWYILDCLLGDRVLISDFGEQVKIYLNQHYTGFDTVSYGDPAGNQEGDKSLKTSVQILSDIGFNVYSRPSNTSQTNYDARKAIIDGKLQKLINSSPALIINDTPNNTIIIEGFEGGYHYPEAMRSGHIKTQPVKEGYFEHAFNALEYISVNIFSPTETKRQEIEPSYRIVGDVGDVHWDDDEDDGCSREFALATGRIDE